MLYYNRIYLRKVNPPPYPISNFTFSASINDLPRLSITRTTYPLRNNQYNKKEDTYTTSFIGENTVSDFNIIFSGNTADYTLFINDSILYGLEFNLVSKSTDNNLEYVMFNKFNRVICNKTMTLCQSYISSILNYFNNNLNLPSGYRGLGSIDYNFIFGRIDLDNTTLIDFLNSLEDYGLYWFIDYRNGYIYIKRYDNFTPSGNIKIIGDYSINVEKREFQGIKVIKEAYETILEEHIHIEDATSTSANYMTIGLTGNCNTIPGVYERVIDFNTPVKPYLYSWNINVFSNVYYAYIIMYYNKDGKCYIQNLYSNGDFCQDCDIWIYRVNIDRKTFYLKYKGKDAYGGCVYKCAEGEWNTWCQICGSAVWPYNNDICMVVIDGLPYYFCSSCNPNPPNDILGTHNDCYDKVFIGIATSQQTQVTIDGYLNPGNVSTGICLTNPEDTPCILTGDYLKQYEVYIGNELNKNCAVEKRFNSINSTTLYNLIVPYYQTLLNNPDRIVVNGNIFSAEIPQVGLRYNVQVGSRVINSMLLKSIEITPEGIRGEFVWPF